MSYSQASGAATLRAKYGFRGNDAQVISAFQGGYNLGAWLAVDGACGPATSAAIARTIANGGRASAHFFFSEWRCTCHGRHGACRGVLVDRDLLRHLEPYRAASGPVTINSGYRCPGRNKEVGGAANSQHQRGKAADINGRFRPAQMAKFGFRGKGVKGSNGLVIHVDMREVQVRDWRYAN